MKKLIALLLVMGLALTFAACGEEAAPTETTAAATTPTEATPPAVMSHADFMAAEIDDQVTIEAYVQATQSWWDNKITVYAQDQNGGYFLYEMACTEEDAAKLTPGTKIRVTGDKAEWSGEIEIMNATFEFVEGEGSYIAPPTDVTELLGTEQLIEKQNQKVRFTGVTIEKITYKNDEPGDDIYVTIGYNGASYEFCVERYLTGPETTLYNAVAYLKEGDVVDIEGYLYWYEGVNTHITAITKDGLPIVDKTPYLPYLATWYANGSSAAYRFTLSDDLTWELQDSKGEYTMGGNFLTSEEGLQLYDNEGILAVVLYLESEKEARLDTYVDELMDLNTYVFLNEITNDEPEHIFSEDIIDSAVDSPEDQGDNAYIEETSPESAGEG